MTTMAMNNHGDTPKRTVEGVKLTRAETYWQSEWQSERSPIHGCRIVDNTGRMVAADIYDEEIAELIVGEHNAAVAAKRGRTHTTMTTKRTGYPVIDEILESIAPKAEPINGQEFCNCGATGHKDQIDRYPVGAKVVTTDDIPQCEGNSVPLGTTGTVTGHCDDGRAWFRFEHEPQEGHTFHFPEQWVAVLAQTCRHCASPHHNAEDCGAAPPRLTEEEAQLVIGAIPLQALPDTPATTREEWIYTYTTATGGLKHNGWHIRERYGNGDCVAHAETERVAKQIVTDHQLAVLVPGLLDVLHDTHTWLAALAMMEDVNGLEAILGQINAVLNEAKGAQL